MKLPILYIGGLASKPAAFAPIHEQLSDGFERIIIDPYLPQGKAHSDFESLAQALQTALPKQPQCIVTHSMGVILALKLLPLLERLPKALIVLHPITLSDVENRKKRELLSSTPLELLFVLTRRSFSKSFLRSQGAMMRKIFSRTQAEAENMVTAQLTALHTMKPIDLKAARPPTLVVIAQHDMVVPVDEARTTAEQIADHIIVLDNVKEHGFPLEHAELTAGAIQTFLSQYL